MAARRKKRRSSSKKKRTPANKKGVPGKGTGGTARKLIRAKSRCRTQAQIGRSIGRSASVVGQIKRGEIKNPPKQVVTRLRSISCRG